MTVQSGSRCYTGHAKTGIERHTHEGKGKRREKGREREKKREGSFTCILAEHRVFEGCDDGGSGTHEAYARELATCLFLSRHPLSCASLSLPGVSLRYILALVPPRPAAAGVPSPFFRYARLCQVMSCLPLASSPTPRHNLPQTLKRSGLLQGNRFQPLRRHVFLRVFIN